MHGDKLTSAWYIIAGTVTIDAAGRIEVDAINSAERTVHCVLRGKPEGIEQVPRDEVPSDQVPSTKVIENGMMYIMYKGTKYNVLGGRIER